MAQPATSAHGTAPPLAPPPADPSGIPEHVLRDWRWVFQGREDGSLAAYRGQHIAVADQQVIASHPRLEQLEQILRTQFRLEPRVVTTAYIEEW